MSAEKARHAAMARLGIPIPGAAPQPETALTGKRGHASVTGMGQAARASIAARKHARTEEGATRDMPTGEADKKETKPAVRMRHRLRNKLAAWQAICTSTLVLGWIATGFPLRWNQHGEPPKRADRNQASAAADAPFGTARCRSSSRLAPYRYGLSPTSPTSSRRWGWSIKTGRSALYSTRVTSTTTSFAPNLMRTYPTVGNT